VGLEKWT